MRGAFRAVKEGLEQITGSRIYRNSLPHGVDCSFDIARRLGRENIRVVLDVGANMGQSAMTYLHQFPQAQIHSFEPVSATFKQLAANTARSSRIHAYNFGMGSAAGEAVIHVNPVSRMSSIKLQRPEDHSETIALDTVAGFVEKHGLGTIDFLKIDTEGADLDVLAGAAPLLKQQRIHFVQCECEPIAFTNNFVSFPALAEFLGAYGYRLFGVYEQQPHFDGTRRILYWNAVFICEKLIPPDARLP